MQGYRGHYIENELMAGSVDIYVQNIRVGHWNVFQVSNPAGVGVGIHKL